MSDFTQDLVYAMRRLRAAPAFALTAILTMALGIGANTAIFSIVNGVLLRPLPFPDPDQLYTVYTANRTGHLLQASVSPVDLDDWRASRHAIVDLGGYYYSEGSTGVDLTGRGAPRRLSAVFVTPGFFTTLGVTARAGRLPQDHELVRGGHDRVVMLSSSFWQREFGGSPAIVGTTLTLDGEPYDVLGVLPESMRFPTAEADVFVPYSTIPDSGIPRLRQVRVLDVIGRAGPGVTRDAVTAEMMGITAGLAAQYPEDRAWNAATVLPLADVVSGPVRAGLLVLAGAVGLGPADFERQCGRTPAGASDGPWPRNRRAPGAWRAARTGNPATAHRKRSGLARGRRDRDRRGEARHRGIPRPRRRPVAPRLRSDPRRHRPGLRLRGVASRRRAVRDRAGLAVVARRRDAAVARHGPLGRGLHESSRPCGPRRRRNRDRDGACRRRRPDEPQFPGAARRGPGLPP